MLRSSATCLLKAFAYLGEIGGVGEPGHVTRTARFKIVKNMLSNRIDSTRRQYSVTVLGDAMGVYL